MTAYGLEKLIEHHNSVGFDRQSDHHAESRMADIRRRVQVVTALTPDTSTGPLTRRLTVVKP